MNVVDEINLDNKNQVSNSSQLSSQLSSQVPGAGSKSGLKIERHFTKEGVSPFDQFTYEKHVSLIKNPDGTLVFHNDNVEVPNFWSQVSTDILAQKYFRKAGVPLKDAQGNLLYDENGKVITGGETSIKQVAHRIAGCWRWWGEKYNYFASVKDAQVYYDEMVHMIINQTAAPNSPQWFTTGLHFAYGLTGPAQGHSYVDPVTKQLEHSKDAYSRNQPHACADYYTQVYTEEGTRYIGEIVKNNQTGLKVFDGEKFVKVLATKDNGEKEVFRIKLKNGNYIDLTKDHLVLSAKAASHNGSNYSWKEVVDLNKGEKVQQPLLLQVHEKNVFVQDLSKARLAGWVIGDGSVGIYQGVMRLEIISINNEEQTKIIEDIHTVFGQDVSYWITTFNTKDKNLEGKRIHLSGKKLHSFVAEYDLVKSRSRTAEVPKKIVYASPQEKREFLKALFQADGCVRIRVDENRNSGDVCLTTASKKLSFGVLQLLNSLGIYSRISFNSDKRENRAGTNQVIIAYGSAREQYQEQIGFISEVKIEKLALLNMLVQRSQTLPLIREETIISIESIGVKRVFDIQTESVKFLGNGIVIHNCFIQKLDDDLVRDGGIFSLLTREARIFKYGSGSGSNFSRLRGKGEKLSGGGTSSGLMSFLKIFDVAAGSVKSGGTTRRAAKMVCLDLDHPDILDFIWWKVREEEKVAQLVAGSKILKQRLSKLLELAREQKNPFEEKKVRQALKLAAKSGIPLSYLIRALDLAKQGRNLPLREFDTHYESEAYLTVSGQNSNNSVRIPNDFFEAVKDNKDWELKARTNGQTIKKIPAKDLWEDIAYCAWASADPGVQYDTTINEWHTSPESGRINGSNPCVTGDTKVLTKDGKWRRIDSLLDQSTTIIVNTGFLQEVPISGSFKTGTKPVYKLTTKSGYELKLTADHKVFTLNRDFVQACELSKDDLVLLPMQEAAELKEIEDSEFYQMLGVYLGDGCGGNISSTRGIALTMNKESETAILEKFAEYVATSYERITHRDSPALVQMTKTSAKYVITNQILLRKIEVMVNLKLKSHEKCISEEMFALPLSAQRYIIQGLFTADGTVAYYPKKGSYYVSLDSSSLQLLKDIQIMLLGFGIKSKIYSDRRAGKDKAWLPDGKGGLKEYSVQEMHSLRISRANRVKFGKLIGFMPESPKNEKLNLINKETEAYSENPFDSVDKLEYIGIEEVYDLTEPLTHTFVANGITIHNCSEYMYLDDTSCNLASINLVRFYDENSGNFDIAGYQQAIRLWTIALEISILMAQFPSEQIAINTYRTRSLGLGFANLGTLLMMRSLPYDSEQARALSGALAAILTGEAYATSAELAQAIEAFEDFEKNREPMLRVIRNHRRAAHSLQDYESLSIKPMGIDEKLCPAEFLSAARDSWDRALSTGEKFGYRNAQVSVMAPTGCLVGGSLVTTEQGIVRLRSLGNIKGEKWQNTSFKVLTDEGPKQATKFFINGEAETRLIRTSAGYEIQGTPNHQIKVLNKNNVIEWKKLAQITPGDKLPLSMNGIFEKTQMVFLPPLPELHWNTDFDVIVPREMNQLLAELIGYFMGDGSLHSKGLRFCVTNGDDDVTQRLVDIIKELFNLECKITPQEGYMEVAVNSVPLTIWWEACGFAKLKPADHLGGKGYQPYIPDAVLYTNQKEVYCAFIKGLFEADGTVTNGTPSWCTAHKEFNQEVKTILLSLGYPTTNKIDISGWGQSEIYSLRLRNTSYNEKFRREIGFISSRKISKILISTKSQAGKKDLIYIKDDLGVEISKIEIKSHDAVMLSLRRHKAISRQSAELLYQQTQDKKIAQALDFFYDEVEANEEGGIQSTYDISVPENVTYIANGFISHNTIGLVMDCDTTGVEPDYSLVKYKKLAGGGFFKIVNQSVPKALKNLGYNSKEIEEIISFCLGHSSFVGCPAINESALLQRGLSLEQISNVEKDLKNCMDINYLFNAMNVGAEFYNRTTNNGEKNFLSALGFSEIEIEKANDYICGTMTLEDAPHLKEEHYPVFDCANKCGKKGKRYIHPYGHLKMLSALQPFVSGAISKTINMPNDWNIEQIKKAYYDAWTMMLKGVALYRDGCKLSQPLNSTLEEHPELKKILEEESDEDLEIETSRKIRKRVLLGKRELRLSAEQKEGQLVKMEAEMDGLSPTQEIMLNALTNSINLHLQTGTAPALIAQETLNLEGHPLIEHLREFLVVNGGDSSEINAKVVSNSNFVVNTSSSNFSSKKESNSLANNSLVNEIISSNTSGKMNCSSCGASQLRQNGTCQLCEVCGQTSGCS